MRALVEKGVVVGSILLSASTYLFDFASNMVVLQQYSARYLHALKRHRQGPSACDATCRFQYTYLAAYFYGLLVILLFSHSLNALLFKLKFKQHHAPCCAAYFLPLIHLHALLNLLWRTLGCKGVQELRSSEMNGLYSILGVALEGIPMLILQFAAYLALSQYGVFLHGMPASLKVSVVASFISATYNGGAAVQSVAKNAINLKDNVMVGAVAGGFTLCATLLRSVTAINILQYINEYLSLHQTDQEYNAKFNNSDVMYILVCACTIAAYCLYYWLLNRPANFFKSLRDPHQLLVSLVFGYMSLIMGPLYPMVSLASDMNQLGQSIFRCKLCTLALLNLSLDITFLIVTLTMGTLPKPYLIVSALAATFYLIFLCAYMKVDVFCGPMRSSIQQAELQTGHRCQSIEHPEPPSTQPAQAEHAELPLLEIVSSCEQEKLQISSDISSTRAQPRPVVESEHELH